jgi:hypothetical protein
MDADGRRSRTQRFLLPLAGSSYGLASHCSNNREACPDIFMTIDQTVVYRLFAVTLMVLSTPFLECELCGFPGDVENDRTTRSTI